MRDFQEPDGTTAHPLANIQISALLRIARTDLGLMGDTGIGWCARVGRKATGPPNAWEALIHSALLPMSRQEIHGAMGPKMRSFQLLAMAAPAFMSYLFKPLEAGEPQAYVSRAGWSWSPAGDKPLGEPSWTHPTTGNQTI